MIVRINKSGAVMIFAGLIALLIGAATFSPVLCTFFTVLFWGAGMIYALRDMKHNFAFFGFNVGFFAFLLGGYLLDFMRDLDFSFFLSKEYSATDEAIEHTCFSLMLTAIVVNPVYIAFHRKVDAIAEETVCYNSQKIVNLRKILSLALIVTYICKLYCGITDMILVQTVSYRGATQYISSVPTVITSLSSLYYITLFVYWATLPPKRETVCSIIALMVVEIINLLAGERASIVSLVLAICFYLLLRNRVGLRDIQIKKKAAVAVVLLLPFIMYGLQAMSYLRNGQTYNEGISEGVISFMEAQGGSVKIIANSYDLDEEISDLVGGKRAFVFGEIKRYLKSNIFTRLLTGKSGSLRTVEDAKSGEYFLQSYGYAHSPTTYLSGVGGGSTYIAEVYYDGGYVFLVIFNLFVVFLLLKISSGGGHSIIKNAISLNIFRFIPLLPRGMALAWFTNTFAIQNLFIYILLAIYLRGDTAQMANSRLPDPMSPDINRLQI